MDKSQPPPRAYAYRSLSSPKSFRLLRLHDAASFEDPVECTLEAHELDGGRRPAYTALSYTWGGSSRDEAIAVAADGAAVGVTPTLVEALRHMRELQRDRDDAGGGGGAWWWVDMVCIDQDNLDERSRQVAMMRDIFQTATSTVAWLGPAGDGSDELMGHLAEKAPPHSSRRDFRAWKGSAGGRAAIEAFQGRAYWGRAWIIQEVCVSREVVLACGRRTAAWRALDGAHKWLRTYPRAHSTPDLRVLRRRFQEQDLHLGFLVYRAGAARCANARDKVFSLLGLVTGGQGARIAPDYSMSPCAVFAAAIRAAEADLGQSRSEAGPSRGRWRRADSFRKKLVVIMDEIRAHPHQPLDEDDGARLGCEGFECGMWELCWKFSGIALQLE